MNRTLSAIAIVALLALAGCGSGNGYSSESSSSTGGETSGGGSGSNSGYGARYGEGESSGGAPSTVAVGRAEGVGQVLVDSNGMTLYYFKKDEGGKSSCYGGCAGIWPPLMTGGAPKATGGAEASKLGTTERSDGTTQVTYAGWPLYTYTVDKNPGEAKGTDVKSFGASWYPLHPNGEKAGE